MLKTKMPGTASASQAFLYNWGFTPRAKSKIKNPTPAAYGGHKAMRGCQGRAAQPT